MSIPPAKASITVSQLEEEYKTYQKRWQVSPVRAELSKVFQDRKGPPLKIQKLIGVGLGSVSREGRVNSLWQLACFMDLPILLKDDQVRAGSCSC